MFTLKVVGFQLPGWTTLSRETGIPDTIVIGTITDGSLLLQQEHPDIIAVADKWYWLLTI